jgi:hypothetical protein
VLVVELADLDRVAPAEVRPQRLLHAPAVVRDDRVGRVEDRLRGAVVLLQPDHGRVREVVLEVEDVADVGPAEAVDRLVRIAHHEQVAVRLAGQQLQQAVLRVVRVLVLVDEDVAEGRAVAGADLGEELQHVHRAAEQVVEVHRVRAVQALLVEVVDVGDGLLEVGADELAVGGGVAQLVLGVGDLVVQRGGGEALGVDAQLVDAALDQPPRVGLVVDRELARVAQARRLRPQDARAGGVEGHDPHPPGHPPEQHLDALAHLLRRLVREGDGQDLARARDVRLHEPGDAVGQDARLARPRAGQHEQRPVAVHDRLALLGVEPREQGLQAVVGGGLRHPGRGYGGGRRCRRAAASALHVGQREVEVLAEQAEHPPAQRRVAAHGVGAPPLAQAQPQERALDVEVVGVHRDEAVERVHRRVEVA